MINTAEEEYEKISVNSINTRLSKNSVLEQKRQYNLIWMYALTQLQSCLSWSIEEFDKKTYLKKIDNIKEQINIGQQIIEKINNGMQISAKLQIPNYTETFDLQESIKQNLEQLEENLKKLEEFLWETPFIEEYKKDTDKYTKEILKIIDIIQ